VRAVSILVAGVNSAPDQCHRVALVWGTNLVGNAVGQADLRGTEDHLGLLRHRRSISIRTSHQSLPCLGSRSRDKISAFGRVAKSTAY
jgi:hypothetical protein